VPTPLNAVHDLPGTPSAVFALYSDRAFQEGKLIAAGGLDPEVADLEAGDGTLTVVTRQAIPASVLPSMVASMMSGNPVTERTERWRAENDGYVADFNVVIKGAPAKLEGTMTLTPAGDGSTLTIDAKAAVPIPMFGGKIESIIVEQVGDLLSEEQDYTRNALAG
jgi:hypothetical protein